MKIEELINKYKDVMHDSFGKEMKGIVFPKINKDLVLENKLNFSQLNIHFLEKWKYAISWNRVSNFQLFLTPDFIKKMKIIYPNLTIVFDWVSFIKGKRPNISNKSFSERLEPHCTANLIEYDFVNKNNLIIFIDIEIEDGKWFQKFEPIANNDDIIIFECDEDDDENDDKLKEMIDFNYGIGYIKDLYED